MKLSNKKLFALIIIFVMVYGLSYWVLGNYLTAK